MNPRVAPIDLDERRRTLSATLDPRRRSELGQYLTPSATARFMARLLEFRAGESIRLLDPGAGIGVLTSAAVARLAAGTDGGEKAPRYLTCYEIEATFWQPLELTLRGLEMTWAEVIRKDFIEEAVKTAAHGKRPYTHAILNPPYGKIRTGSRYRSLVRRLGLETSNLYACFVACTVAVCAPGAQIVAIIPRSWMNGLYFKPFRKWLLDRVSLAHIHVFDRRDRAFADDQVLQENVIVKLLVGRQQGRVEVTASSDDTFSDLRHRTVHFDEVVTPGDEEQFVHVPAVGAADTSGLPGLLLREIGLDVCTGPVVDFRLREHIHMFPMPDDAPLFYPTHFVGGSANWPKQARKPNAIAVNDATRRWLMPSGTYVVTRRFTSKEERRRVVAYLLPAELLAGRKRVGFENHLNVLHCGKHGLDPAVARGLCAYLNSQAVDDYFRTFSGHTQVNATDLRRLRYPTLEQLREMGERDAKPRSGRASHPHRHRNAEATAK